MKLFVLVIIPIIGCSSARTNEKFEVLNALDYAADADCNGGYNACVNTWLNSNLSVYTPHCGEVKNQCLHDCMISCSVHIDRNHQSAFDACQRSCIGNDQ